MEKDEMEELVQSLDNGELAWLHYKCAREIENRLIQNQEPSMRPDPKNPPAPKPEGGGHGFYKYCLWKNQGGLK